MNLGIEGRTALVIGSSRGIGLEVARELRAEGCEVLGISRSGDGPFAHIRCDLLQEGAPEYAAALLRKMFSVPDIIVHVLGGSQGITGTLLPSSEWAKVWRLNLGIAHDFNCAFIPDMQRNKWGRIVHISSNAPRVGMGYCPFASAKAALDGYVKIVSKEFSKDGVIIAAVAPGIIHTPGRYYASLNDKQQEEYFNRYIPIQRFGRAEEIAKAVAYLASDHSAYMAGSVVAMDGGAR